MSSTDYTKLLAKLIPDAGGEDTVRMRVGVVAAVNANGTLNVTVSGQTVPAVPVLNSSAGISSGSVVQMISYRGQLLVLGKTANGPAPSPRVLALFSGGLNSGSLVTFTMTPNSVPINSGGMWVSGTNFTISTPGEYEVGVSLGYPAAPSGGPGQRRAEILLNGSTLSQWNDTATASASGWRTTVGGVIRRVLSSGDTIAFGAAQNSGTSPLNLTSDSCGWIQFEGNSPT